MHQLHSLIIVSLSGLISHRDRLLFSIVLNFQGGLNQHNYFFKELMYNPHTSLSSLGVYSSWRFDIFLHMSNVCCCLTPGFLPLPKEKKPALETVFPFLFLLKIYILFIAYWYDEWHSKKLTDFASTGLLPVESQRWGLVQCKAWHQGLHPGYMWLVKTPGLLGQHLMPSQVCWRELHWSWGSWNLMGVWSLTQVLSVWINAFHKDGVWQ